MLIVTGNASFHPQRLLVLLTFFILFSCCTFGSDATVQSLPNKPQASDCQGGENTPYSDGVATIIRRSVAEAPNDSATGNSSTTLILAPRRTRRSDPLDGFKLYTGGWNISDQHYWASVAFTAVPLFIIAGVWFLVFGLCLLIIFFRHCCCKREPFGYSRVCYALSLIFLIFFTIAAIAGCIVLYTGQEKFHTSTTSTLNYVIDQADTTVWKLRNVSGYLAAAKKIGVYGVGLPSDVQTHIDDIVTKTNSSANVLENKTTKNADGIHNVLDTVRIVLIIIAATMLFFTFVGFLLSLFGLQSFVYVLVVLGWIFVAGTFILCGIFVVLHNVTEDTCVSMNQWVQHPMDHTALDDILPCVDNTTSQETLNRSKEVTSQIVEVIDQVITNVSNIDFSSNFKPMYYNQSGPKLPLLCNPFYKDLTNRPCSSSEVDMDNATQVWKNYVCKVSSSGICVTTGRLTPTYYNQLEAAVNVSYGLYNYGPFLVDLQDCTFVRQTFTDINRDHCPGLQQYSKWVYVGLALVSGAVMLSLTFWVIYGRERKHRVYTKHVIEERGGKTY